MAFLVIACFPTFVHAGIAPDTVDTHDGTLVAYARSDGAVAVRSLRDSHTELIPAQSFSAPTLARSGNEITLYYKNSSCRVSQHRRNPRGDWSTEQRLRVPSKFNVEIHQHGQLGTGIFAVNGDGALERWIQQGGAWQRQFSLGGNLSEGVSAVTSSDGSVFVFGRDISGRLVTKRWRDPVQTACTNPPCTAWSTWRAIGGRIKGAPQAIRRGDRIELYARSTDDRLVRRYLLTGQWSDWHGLGIGLSSAPAVTTAANDGIVVVARGGNAGTLLLKRWRDPSTLVCANAPCDGWSSWNDLGPSVAADLPMPNCQRDSDNDGISDSLENRLLDRFAPKIWLHEDETSKPVTVAWLLERSRLRMSHGGGCRDHGLADWGLVTAQSLISQSHREVHEPPWCWPWKCCKHKGNPRRSDSFSSDIPKRNFFLQFRNSAHRGLDSPDDWLVYGHVYPSRNGEISVQYWQLYAYNDSIGFINHEGDWEFSAVRINGDLQVTKVAHYRHGRVVENDPDDVEWDGNHHITYSAKGSHSQYAKRVDPLPILTESCDDEGFKDAAQGDLLARDKCSQGILWQTWPEGGFGRRRIVNMGEIGFPSANSVWLQFSGLWGEIGAGAINTPLGTPITFTSGPKGPAYQKGWNLWGADEVCDNSVDDDIDGNIDEADCL